MTDAKNARQEDLSTALRNVLNYHGDGFHYRTLQACLETFTTGGTPLWRNPVSEFPVELNGQIVHIDFVLGFEGHLLVAECKRVKGFNWGFARSHSRAAS